MNNEFKKLKEQGYTEEELLIKLDELSRINLSSSPLGNERDDRAVKVFDSLGNEKKTSSIMMGYNREKISLGNGDFVSLEELERAMLHATFINGENQKIVYKPTGKVVSTSELVLGISQVLREKEEIILRGKSDKIKNQQTAKVSVKGEGSDTVYNKGVFMLGNDNLQLANGEYVSAQELSKALKDYVVAKPNEKISSPKQESKNEIKKVTKLQKLKVKLWPLILAGTIAITTIGININADKYIESPTISITAEQIESQDVLETESQVAERLQSKYTTGDKIDIQKGIKYHESSNWEYGGRNNNAEFGNPQRPDGEYTLDYFSIIYSGGKVTAEYKQGQNLENVVQKVCIENNLKPNEVDIKFHIGGPVSGWISMNDLQSEKEQTPQVIGKSITVENDYTAVQKNFEGMVTIKTENGLVQLNFLDEDGNLISDGTVLKGSDGREYRITSVEQKYETLVGENNSLNSFGKSVEFELHDLNKEASLLLAGSALGLTALATKRRKEEKEVTQEEYEELLKSFKEKYDKKSKFVQLINKLSSKKPDWEKINISLQKGEITIDQISEMYDKGGSQR